MVNGRTHWPYTAAGGERAGYRRTVGFKVDRGGKGKAPEGTLVKERGDLSWSIIL